MKTIDETSMPPSRVSPWKCKMDHRFRCGLFFAGHILKAIFCRQYGPPEVLRIEDIEKPGPRDDEVLIQIRATTVTAGDCRVRGLKMPAGMGLIARLALGITKPRQPILGSELSGVVVAVGKSVRKFKVGDEVFAFTGVKLGCHAEFKCIPESGGVVLKPEVLSFEEAAAISTGGTTALAFLKKANVQSGERVAVVGASGSVGSAAVQLAKHFGAHVTAITSTSNQAMVRDLGADEVIDYTQEDFTKRDGPYDVILEAVGAGSIASYKSALKADGRLLLVSGGLMDALGAPGVALTSKQRVVAGPAAWNSQDLQLIVGLAESGKFRPIIDRVCDYRQVQEAHHYVDSGRKRGNVILSWTSIDGS